MFGPCLLVEEPGEYAPKNDAGWKQYKINAILARERDRLRVKRACPIADAFSRAVTWA